MHSTKINKHVLEISIRSLVLFTNLLYITKIDILNVFSFFEKEPQGIYYLIQIYIM